MRAFLLSSCLTFMLPSVGLAQDANVDAETVRTCHKETPDYEDQPDCIGDASNTCQLELKYQDTPSIAACISAEADVWDEILNEEYGRLNANFANIGESGLGASGEELRIALRDAQRSWIAFRDADCGLRYTIHLAGTIRSITASSCRLKRTAIRALELRDLQKP